MAAITLADVFFEGPWSEQLREQREKARIKRVIPFDCYNAKVHGLRVVCSHGFPLGRSRDGSVALGAVLEGKGSSRCQLCIEYDDAGEPGD